ncbi:hypothetical protein BDZ97DRAFT_1752328 [Flammula alnicola]|nr:hypothetical protein BDZ97DRAFT_1752328 [Flammula alnicola]
MSRGSTSLDVRGEERGKIRSLDSQELAKNRGRSANESEQREESPLDDNGVAETTLRIDLNLDWFTSGIEVDFDAVAVAAGTPSWAVIGGIAVAMRIGAARSAHEISRFPNQSTYYTKGNKERPSSSVPNRPSAHRPAHNGARGKHCHRGGGSDFTDDRAAPVKEKPALNVPCIPIGQ